MRTFLVTLAAALALPAAAAAGGWATAGLAPPPDGIEAGTTWPATITLLQHGRTPLEQVKPSITVTDAGSGGSTTFPARPTGKPGVYVAEVVFPSAGEYTYVVDDGFSQVHTFAPVQVAGPGAAATDGGGGLPAWALGLVAAAGAAALALVALLRRRRIGRTPRAVPALD